MYFLGKFTRNFYENQYGFRFLAFFRSEILKTNCSNWSIFETILSLFDCGETRNVKKTANNKLEKMYNRTCLYSEILRDMWTFKYFRLFRKSKNCSIFLKVNSEEMIYFSYVVKWITFEKKGPLTENPNFCQKPPFFDVKKLEYVNECLRKFKTYGRQRDSKPPPLVFQPRWHRVHVIYRTPTTLQTLFIPKLLANCRSIPAVYPFYRSIQCLMMIRIYIYSSNAPSQNTTFYSPRLQLVNRFFSQNNWFWFHSSVCL